MVAHLNVLQPGGEVCSSGAWCALQRTMKLFEASFGPPAPRETILGHILAARCAGSDSVELFGKPPVSKLNNRLLLVARCGGLSDAGLALRAGSAGGNVVGVLIYDHRCGAREGCDTRPLELTKSILDVDVPTFGISNYDATRLLECLGGVEGASVFGLRCGSFSSVLASTSWHTHERGSGGLAVSRLTQHRSLESVARGMPDLFVTPAFKEFYEHAHESLVLEAVVFKIHDGAHFGCASDAVDCGASCVDGKWCAADADVFTGAHIVHESLRQACLFEHDRAKYVAYAVEQASKCATTFSHECSYGLMDDDAREYTIQCVSAKKSEILNDFLEKNLFSEFPSAEINSFDYSPVRDLSQLVDEWCLDLQTPPRECASSAAPTDRPSHENASGRLLVGMLLTLIFMFAFISTACVRARGYGRPTKLEDEESIADAAPIVPQGGEEEEEELPQVELTVI